MTRADIEEIALTWRERLNLAHWTIRFSYPAEIEGDPLAETIGHDDYDHAEIRFSPSFPSWTREYANTVVVHELMHLVTRDLARACESLDELLSAGARSLFKSWFDHELEGVVDRTAALLVGLGGVV